MSRPTVRTSAPEPGTSSRGAPPIAGSFDLLPAEMRRATAVGKTANASETISFPFTSLTTFRVVPPDGFVAGALPEDLNRKLDSVAFSMAWCSGSEGSVICTATLDVSNVELSSKDVDGIRGLLGELVGAGPIGLSFDNAGHALVARGKVREGIAELRRLSKTHSDDPAYRMLLARELLDLGLGIAAREEGRAIVATAPKSADAHRCLAWILEHDDAGIQYGQGFDRAGAIAAYGTAKELAPDELESRRGLASLLEHDLSGLAFGDGSDLASAVTELRAVRERAAGEKSGDDLLESLLRSGRFAEVLEIADPRSPGNLAARLGAIAALSGAPAAIARAIEELPDPIERGMALNVAAAKLLTLRRGGGCALEGGAPPRPRCRCCHEVGKRGLGSHLRRDREECLGASGDRGTLPRSLRARCAG